MEGLNMIEDCTPPSPPPLSIGEEFVNWADKYWHLSDAYGEMFKAMKEGEYVDYKAIREYLADGIDTIIQRRING